VDIELNFTHRLSYLLRVDRMARDMTDKDILKMELDQLKVEVNTPRIAVKILKS